MIKLANFLRTLAGVGMLLSCTIASAAKITSADVKNEGPLRLAGDSLMVSVLLEPGESEIRLEVRAYFANGADTQDFAPLMAKGKGGVRDSRLLARTSLRRATEGVTSRALQTISTEIRVDGKGLDLPDGVNQVQYEVSAVVPGAEGRNDVVPTAIWPVYVKDGVRVLPTTEFLAVKPAVQVIAPLASVRVPLQDRPIRVGLPSETNYKRWIYFATNRTISILNLQKTYPFKSTYSEFVSDKLFYGVAETNVPYDIHEKGALDLGGWAGKKVAEAFTMKKPLLDYEEDNFYKSLLKDDVLVFVHGFNNSFENAVVQASQLRVDIGFRNFRGKIVAFSWPARGGNVAEYRSDAARAERSVPAMTRFLSTLIERNAAAKTGDRRKIHLIAHSMGNRVLLGAIHKLVAEKPQKMSAGSFGNIFLAAPDVNADQFPVLVDSAALASDRITVYYSQKDVALWWSEFFNRDQRAGKNPRIANGAGLGKVDFICTDNVNTWKNRFGHGYFAGVDSVLTDIALLLEYNLPPAQRRGLLMPGEQGPACWAFRPPERR